MGCCGEKIPKVVENEENKIINYSTNLEQEKDSKAINKKAKKEEKYPNLKNEEPNNSINEQISINIFKDKKMEELNKNDNKNKYNNLMDDSSSEKSSSNNENNNSDQTYEYLEKIS